MSTIIKRREDGGREMENGLLENPAGYCYTEAFTTGVTFIKVKVNEIGTKTHSIELIKSLYWSD